MQRKLFVFLAVLALSAPLVAQQNFFAKWGERASATQAKQPAWPPPIITTYVGLIEVARVDFIRQTAPNLATTWNFDGGKGLNLVPIARTEVAVNLPGYFEHSSPAVTNGAGDMSFLLKYRYLSGNAQHGNYDLCAFLSSTIPTGSYKNGAPDATVSPNLGFGKGWGPVAVQSTIGASLPVMDTAKLGRTVAWNDANQLRVAKYFWPEVEINSTWFTGGANDGKNMTFVTPGLLVSRKCHPHDAHSRLGITIGAGDQIALTHFHTYNHEIAVTSRVVF